MNFHMNSMDKTLTELHGMLKTAEESIKKSSNHVMMVQNDKDKKRKRWPSKVKAKGKVPAAETSKTKPAVKAKSGPSPDDEWFHCKGKGHWSRNCKKYLEDKKKKGGSTSASGPNKD